MLLCKYINNFYNKILVIVEYLFMDNSAALKPNLIASNLFRLTVSDGNGGVGILTVKVKLCVCNLNGLCAWDNLATGYGNVDNFIIVTCKCHTGWIG